MRLGAKKKGKTYKWLYKSLGTNEGEKSIYRLSKGRERKIRDLDQVKCVKYEEGKLFVQKNLLRMSGRRISTIYLMKDMIFRWTLADSTLEKKIETIITTIRFINKR